MNRPPSKSGEVRVERCTECGEFHTGPCAPTPRPEGEVAGALPLFDGTTPLPMMDGYRFRLPDGRTGSVKSVEAMYSLDDMTCQGTAMVAVLDR